MRPINHQLHRLLNAAQAAYRSAEQAEAELPFGFEQRVLAALRAPVNVPDFAGMCGTLFYSVFSRRALACAVAFMLLTIGWNYRELNDYAQIALEPGDELRLVNSALDVSLEDYE